MKTYVLSRRAAMTTFCAFVAVTLCLGACTVSPVDYTGKQCPCILPWVCGEGGVCQLPTADASPDSDAPLDSDLEPDADHSDLAVRRVVAGRDHTCALLSEGAIRCWGEGELGALGYGSTEDVGDDETPASVGDVPLGGTATELSVKGHTCAVLDTGTLRCWGDGSQGQLGYGNVFGVGDDETPASVGDIDVGDDVIDIAVGVHHTCAVLVGGRVRCWGDGSVGQLGYGTTESIGDDEPPTEAGDVDVGGVVDQVVVGELHTCALLDNGAVRCWGSGADGRLGTRSTRDVGDDETPASVGDIEIGGVVTQLAAGWAHTCALLETGAVRCWGLGNDGRLGYGNERNVGDNETPESAGDVDVGGVVTHITAGMDHSCAVFDTRSVRCWGGAAQGQLGYGNTNAIGDDEVPAEAGYVDVGGHVVQVTAGGGFTCVLLETGAVRCWGSGSAIGLGDLENTGDDESPASVDFVPLL